jgi:ABC-type transport system substrate-binding protein
MSTAADAITRLIRSLVAASEPRRALGPRWGGPATGGRSWAIAAGGVLLWLLAGVSPAAAEKVLRVGVIRDPVNSQYATPGVEPYITGVYEQLVFVTPSMELAPGLATSWERLGDNQWRFRLRRGVKFHNGKDFNAQTAKFSLDWITEKIVWSKRLRIKEVKVVDDYTIDIFTTTPLAVMPGFMSHGWTVMSEPESQKAGKPVGTGPFKFVSSVPGEQLVVARNEHYWQPGVPKPVPKSWAGCPPLGLLSRRPSARRACSGPAPCGRIRLRLGCARCPIVPRSAQCHPPRFRIPRTRPSNS